MKDNNVFYESQIRACWRESKDAGSCNACTKRINSEGVIPHKVFEITLRTISFRLCMDCYLEMREVLG